MATADERRDVATALLGTLMSCVPREFRSMSRPEQIALIHDAVLAADTLLEKLKEAPWPSLARPTGLAVEEDAVSPSAQSQATSLRAPVLNWRKRQP